MIILPTRSVSQVTKCRSAPTFASCSAARFYGALLPSLWCRCTHFFRPHDESPLLLSSGLRSAGESPFSGAEAPKEVESRTDIDGIFVPVHHYPSSSRALAHAPQSEWTYASLPVVRRSGWASASPPTRLSRLFPCVSSLSGSPCRS